MILALTDTLLAIVAFVLILGAIVLIHEGGHFFFAVKGGILCREYAFGMGPLLWSKKKGETTYSIRALPIGGFCAICGEEAEDDPLKGLSKIRLGIENGVVTKIYLPTDGKKKVNLFDDKPEFTIVSYDLFDKDDTGKLFIEVQKKVNEDGTVETEVYPVARDASYVFGVGRHDDASISLEKRLAKNVQEYQIGPHDRTLNSKSFGRKFMVLFGGPLMNFVLAILAFFVSICITGTSNTSSSVVDEFGYEDVVAEYAKSYKNVTEVKNSANALPISAYGYVTEIESDNVIYIGLDPITTESIKVEFKSNVSVHLYSIVTITGEYNSNNICDAVLHDETRVTSPLYIAGVRAGDEITKLSSDKLVVDVTSWNEISAFMDDYCELENKTEITVNYIDSETKENKTTTVTPMVYIYSVSMVQDYSSNSVRIDELNEKSKAYESGLREGDIIKQIIINDTKYDINSWLDVYEAYSIPVDGKTTVTVKVERDGELLDDNFDMVPYSKKLFDKTQSVPIVDLKMGISCTTTRNIFLVVKATFVQMWTAIVQLFNTLGLLIFSSSVGIKDLSGPVGIFSLTKTAVSGGIGYLFYWLGFLSANVGFMNLLPIPALDGGRILFLIIEKIRRKPLSQKVQDLCINITYYALLALILYVTINDVLRMVK